MLSPIVIPPGYEIVLLSPSILKRAPLGLPLLPYPKTIQFLYFTPELPLFDPKIKLGY